MHFEIDFRNPVTGEYCTLGVLLGGAELHAAGAHLHPEICRQALALRRAYRLVPAGFVHLAAPAGIRAIPIC